MTTPQTDSTSRPLDSGSPSSRFGWRPGVVLLTQIGSFALVFFGVRAAYWAANDERVFSDMEGYYHMAQNILDHFYFGISEELIAYKPPGSSILMAIALAISPAHFETIYIVLTAILAFAGALLIARWLNLTYGFLWGWVFLLAYALLRPSVFWSLKVSTEGLFEALMLLAVGSLVLLLRNLDENRGVAALSISLGASLGFALLVKTQAVFAIGALGLAAALVLVSRARSGTPYRAFGRAVLLAGLSCGAMWLPWVLRNAINYGEFQPLSNHGVIAVFWDYGGNPIDRERREGFMLELPSGERIEPSIGAIRESRSLFQNDFEYAEAYSELALEWYWDNRADLPILVKQRVETLFATSESEGLSTLPRRTLEFAGGLDLNRYLLDWHGWMLVPFAASLAILGWREPRALVVVACVTLAPLAAIILVHARARFLEPYLPTILFAWVALIGSFMKRKGPRPGVGGVVDIPAR